jgi:hypothetical protein
MQQTAPTSLAVSSMQVEMLLSRESSSSQTTTTTTSQGSTQQQAAAAPISQQHSTQQPGGNTNNELVSNLTADSCRYWTGSLEMNKVQLVTSSGNNGVVAVRSEVIITSGSPGDVSATGDVSTIAEPQRQQPSSQENLGNDSTVMTTRQQTAVLSHSEEYPENSLEASIIGGIAEEMATTPPPPLVRRPSSVLPPGSLRLSPADGPQLLEAAQSVSAEFAHVLQQVTAATSSPAPPPRSAAEPLGSRLQATTPPPPPPTPPPTQQQQEYSESERYSLPSPPPEARRFETTPPRPLPPRAPAPPERSSSQLRLNGGGGGGGGSNNNSCNNTPTLQRRRIVVRAVQTPSPLPFLPPPQPVVESGLVPVSISSFG